MALSKAIVDQIAELERNKPNGPAERVTQHNDFVAFLESIASGLDALAEALDQAMAAGPAEKPEPMLLGKAAKIAHGLAAIAIDGIERHQHDILDCTIRFTVFGAGFLFLRAIGVDGYIAGIVAGRMNLRLPNLDK